MNIYELPGYHIENNAMTQRYAESLDAVVCGHLLRDHVLQDHIERQLYHHIERWKAAWELWPRPTKAINDILNHDITKVEINRLREAVNNKKTFVPTENDELVSELILPSTFLMAFFVSKKFEVPFCTALHQSFCNLEDHSNCF